jgi:hypothetical protein
MLKETILIGRKIVASKDKPIIVWYPHKIINPENKIAFKITINLIFFILSHLTHKINPIIFSNKEKYDKSCRAKSSNIHKPPFLSEERLKIKVVFY